MYVSIMVTNSSSEAVGPLRQFESSDKTIKAAWLSISASDDIPISTVISSLFAST